MVRKIILTLMLFIGSISLPFLSFADTETGPYVSGGLGLGYLDFGGIGLAKVDIDEKHLAGRLSAGFRFTKHWGVALGYSRLGYFKNKYKTSDSTVFYSGTAHAAWLALTGRLPVSKRFALLTDIKLTRNWIDTDKKSANVTQFKRLNGAETVLVVGSLGVEFVVDKKSSLSLQLEGFGDAADAVETDLLTLNYQYHF